MITALDHVQLAAPPGSEDALRAYYGDALGMTEIPKPPVLAARGGCWFQAGAVQLHLGIEDGFRGRVFAFYDMVYNAAYAIGAAIFAVFMPFDGKSPVVIAVIAAGFLIAAVAYWLSAGGSPADGSAAEPVSSETDPSPSAAAHRSSS